MRIFVDEPQGQSASSHPALTPLRPLSYLRRMASTPSDVRFTRYAVSQIRRVFGVDLRD